ncbi:Sulfite exporter TauE/SafE [Hartmannibacter diazotrophicus]|uniref:Probable membrane transporter protein n=1 Tax=Hartmannibacter diazotrophicus TaxID=1482074 RepID=A0A2C9D936_9HYPH|nr:TSUP family transporter [Hartmannibacter diazotrophicus]SON56699.1 Sulfite exporter TauE/SafE [Hartmannibacter diazotrophicus]
MTAVIGLAFGASVFLTSALSGVFGMAGGLILLWLLLLLLPASSAIAVHGVIQMVANGWRAVRSRAFIDYRIVAFAVLGLLAIAAVLTLARYTPEKATVCIAIGLMPILVWLPKSLFALDASRPLHAFICGVIAGGLNITVGIAGPTIDVFFIRTAMDRRKIVATKAVVQMTSHALKVIFYARSALALTPDEWLAIAAAAPFAVLGTNAGHAILHRITDHHFRTWTRWIVTVIGAFYMAQGLMLIL